MKYFKGEINKIDHIKRKKHKFAFENISKT